MDDPNSSENNGISIHPTISSVLGVQGPLRIRPHKSRQKAHVILRRVETSDESSDESDGNGSSRFVCFSLFAHKRIEVKPGKEILVAVADGRFKGRPILFTGNPLSPNDASGEEEKGTSTEDDSQTIPFAKHVLPPKMRRALTKKTDEVPRVVNTPSVVHMSVGIQAVPNCDTVSVQARPDSSSVAVQSDTPKSSASVQTDTSVASVSVQVDMPTPQLQVQIRHSPGHHVDAAAQTTRERERSLSPMELDSPTDDISTSSAPSPPPPESPLFSPTVVPSLIANLNTSTTSDSEDEDMQVSPIDTPPPSLLFLPSDNCPTSKGPISKPVLDEKTDATLILKDAAMKDSSSTLSSSISPAPDVVVVKEPTPKPAKIHKKAEIHNPFVSAGFVTEFTGEARALQETSRISNPVESPNTLDVKLDSTTNQEVKLPTPSSPNLEARKASSPSAVVLQTENKNTSNISAANEVAPPRILESKHQAEVPVKVEREGNTPLPAQVEQSDPTLVAIPPATRPKPSAQVARPPSPVRTIKPTPSFPPAIPTGPRNAVASSSRSQLDRIGRSNPPPNAPRAPLSLRAMEKAPAGPPPDPRSVGHISSGPYSNSLGIRPSNVGMNMLYPSPSPSTPSAPKSLAGVSSTKKRVLIGAGWPHVRPTVEATTSSPSVNNTGAVSQTQESKATSADLVSYPKSPSPSRTPPPPPTTQPPAISPQPPPPEPIKIKWKRLDGLSLNTNTASTSSASSALLFEPKSPTNVKAGKSIPMNVTPPEPAPLFTQVKSSGDSSTPAAMVQRQQPTLDVQNSPESSTAPKDRPSTQEKIQKNTTQDPAPAPTPAPRIDASAAQTVNGKKALSSSELNDFVPIPPRVPRLVGPKWNQAVLKPLFAPTPTPVPVPSTNASVSQASSGNEADNAPPTPSSGPSIQRKPRKGIYPMAPLPAPAPHPAIHAPSTPNRDLPSKDPQVSRSESQMPLESVSASASGLVPATSAPISQAKGNDASDSSALLAQRIRSLVTKVSEAPAITTSAASTPQSPNANLLSRSPSFTPTGSDVAPTASRTMNATSNTVTTPSFLPSSVPATPRPPTSASGSASTANLVGSGTPGPITNPTSTPAVSGLPPISPAATTSTPTRNPLSSPSKAASTPLPGSSVPAHSIPNVNQSIPPRPITNLLLPSTPASVANSSSGKFLVKSFVAAFFIFMIASSDPSAPSPTTTNKVVPSPISTTTPSTSAKATSSPTTSGSQPMKHPLPARPTAPPSRGVKRDRPTSPVNARDTIEPLRRRKRVFKWPTLESNHSILLRGEGDLSILGLAFSSDGMFLALNCADKTIRIWNNHTRTEMARLSHNARVVTVMWIEGDSGVVSLGEDGLVSKWTRTGFNHWQWAKVVDTGTEPSAPGEEGGMCLAYKRDRIAVSFPRTGVKVWIWTKGSWQAQRPIVRQNVTALTFIEDGAALLGGTQDGVLWSCQVPNGMLRACAFVKAKITCIEINPAKTHALIAHVGGAARLVSLQPDKKGHAEQSYSNKETQARPQSGFGAIFAAQGQGVLFGDVNGCALVWDTRKGSLVYGLDHGEGERGEEEIIRSAAGFESVNGGGCLVTGTKSGLLSWWSQPAYTNPNANPSSNPAPNSSSDEANKRARVA